MRVFLIRHGETVDNVAGNYAGVTDSALTNHGALQANRLGQYFADTGVIFSHIFSSDLQRAFKTAESLRLPQRKYIGTGEPIAPATRKVSLLRELDFGFYEGKPINKQSRGPFDKGKEVHLERRKSGPRWKDVESKGAMEARAERFFQEYLLSLFGNVGDRYSVAIVSHGIFLTHLWRCILNHFPARDVREAPNLGLAGRGLTLEFPGPWSNTGYLEVQIKRGTGKIPWGNPPAVGAAFGAVPKPSTNTGASALLDMLLVVDAVNSLNHLKGLKKTGGGIGSSKYHDGQQTIESFFKKKETRKTST